ncbi:hypothetical protein IWQ57_001676, partial [Coemansia nantahalensis]
AQLEAAVVETRNAAKEAASEAARVAASANAKALELIGVHDEAVGPASASAWGFRDGTATMELAAALAGELQTYQRLRRAKEYVDAVVAIEAAAAQAATAAADQPQGVLAAFSSADGLLAAHSSAPADGEMLHGSVRSALAAARTELEAARSKAVAHQRGRVVDRAAVKVARADAGAASKNLALLATSKVARGEAEPWFPAQDIARADDGAASKNLALLATARVARGEAEPWFPAQDIARAEAHKRNEALGLERRTLARDRAAMTADRTKVAAREKAVVEERAELQAARMALDAERAALEAARPNLVAARTTEQDSRSRAAFEAADRGPAAMPLGRRQRLHKAASSIFRGSEDKL